MPSHFAAIGTPVDNYDEYVALMDRIAGDAEVFNVSDGYYLRWSSECGAQIWIQINSENEGIGATPYFAGHSHVRVGITNREVRPDDSALEGAFHGLANPSGDNPETGEYPFVFDVPDFCRYADLRLPSIADAQIAAFAHDVAFFDSVEAFMASQTEEPKFAAQSFIPTGLFYGDGEPSPPQAYASFTGHILESQTKVNELTNQPFHWVLVDSLGGSFDVVIEPELVSNSPKVGGVLSGSFWLSGRLTRYTKA